MKHLKVFDHLGSAVALFPFDLSILQIVDKFGLGIGIGDAPYSVAFDGAEDVVTEFMSCEFHNSEKCGHGLFVHDVYLLKYK